jgi:hypothetical protein
MKQSISLITLGTTNYDAAKSFYVALGWVPALEIEETVFFQANGVVLVLDPRVIGCCRSGYVNIRSIGRASSVRLRCSLASPGTA